MPESLTYCNHPVTQTLAGLKRPPQHTMTELSDAHPTLSDEKSSFTLSDAQPELCVVTLSHCDSLSTCARLLLANQHWRGISAQDSTWRALCKRGAGVRRRSGSSRRQSS